MSHFDLAGKSDRIREIEEESQDQGFWDDHQKASQIMQEKKACENVVDTYRELESGLADLRDMMDIAEELEDVEEAENICKAYEDIKAKVESLKLEAVLTGQYDRNNAILSVHAGTGGVDAMDWAEMLMRMYTRWADKKGYKVRIVDLQDDTEAGIKSVTMMIDGINVYGYLKNEQGVHRLVRISPFNAAGKRQTSFAAIEVMPQIEEDEEIDIASDDLKIDTYRSSGKGGQHVNTTDSAVRITHLPTNIVVTCQNERSQHQNRDMAMKILSAKLAELKERQHKENLKDIKGDFSQITWGSQIRSYVFQPYTMVKDHRTNAEVGNVNAVMDGDIDLFINEKLKYDAERKEGK